MSMSVVPGRIAAESTIGVGAVLAMVRAVDTKTKRGSKTVFMEFPFPKQVQPSHPQGLRQANWPANHPARTPTGASPDAYETFVANCCRKLLSNLQRRTAKGSDESLRVHRTSPCAREGANVERQTLN